MSTAQARPFLKWAGGKARALSQLKPLLPSGVLDCRYYEPFVGGGAMFFDLQPCSAVLCDINPHVVNAYKCVRDNPVGVHEYIEAMVPHLNEPYYYTVREWHNDNAHMTPEQKAAVFIFLNKTCYNGLYRENKKGEFNVPAGKIGGYFEAPKFGGKGGFKAASEALRAAEVWEGPFTETMQNVSRGDFAYLDPPYDTLHEKDNFTDYTKSGFGKEHHHKLLLECEGINRRGGKFMQSNADTKYVRELYKDFRIDEIQVPRSINSKGNGRGCVTELVIRNY